MKTFIVTVVDRISKKRRRYVAVAKNWYEALIEAFEEYGPAFVVSVRRSK